MSYSPHICLFVQAVDLSLSLNILAPVKHTKSGLDLRMAEKVSYIHSYQSLNSFSSVKQRKIQKENKKN